MNSFDQSLFLALNASTEHFRSLAWAAFLVAKLVIYLVPVHLILLWVLGGSAARRAALTLFASLILALAASYLLGALFPAQRPFQIPLGHQLLDHRGSPSFPSNHGLIMFTYAMTLALLGWGRLAATIAIAGIAGAWSRIYLGVHFPFDMAGALILSLPVSWLAVRLNMAFGRTWTGLLEHAYLSVAGAPDGWIKRWTGTARTPHGPTRGR